MGVLGKFAALGLGGPEDEGADDVHDDDGGELESGEDGVAGDQVSKIRRH